MILIDVVAVLRSLFVALTPRCLPRWRAGGGAQQPQGSLFKQSSKFPEGLWVK